MAWKFNYLAGSERIAMRVVDGGASTLYYLFSDHLGSTSEVRRADGSLHSRQGYRAFGEVRFTDGALPTDRTYTGQRKIENGLVHYGARVYDPSIMMFNQPDTLIPDPNNPLDWNRYSYSRNNPLNYTDPSGQFAQGVVYEFARTNNWVGAIVSPDAAAVLAPSAGETDAMLAGRVVGDVLTVAAGVVEVVGGVGIAGGGAVVGCGTTLCLASAPAIAAGVTVSGYGVGTAISGAGGLGENLGRLYRRKTEHGELRASQGRPTGPAWTDAQKAGNSGVLYDTETGNYVVRGDKGRIHIFKLEDGVFKHDTSFRNPISNTQERILSGKWEYLNESQYNWWQNRLNSTLKGE